MKFKLVRTLTLVAFVCTPTSTLLAAEQDDLQQLKNELKQLKQRIEETEQTQEETQNAVEELEINVSQQGNQTAANTFNPGIGVILNGRFVSSPDDFEFALPGFSPAEEIGPGEQGLQIGESELNLSANVDDKFYANATLAFSEEGVEVEEAFIQTLNLAQGINIKAGRFFSGVGYLAGKHTHTDDFSDRPLPYQAFFGKNYGDAGVQMTFLAPTDFYWESGFELMRGDGFPAAGAANSGIGARTVFTHFGGDIGQSSSWQSGISYIDADVDGRETDIGDSFSGSNKLTMLDAVYKWSPAGNRSAQEFKLQGEWIKRDENGEYIDPTSNTNLLDTQQSGWYMQAVYRFSKQWRAGIRTARLDADAVSTALTDSPFDPGATTPKQNSVMIDWSNSEFSRIRLQWDINKLDGETDNVFILQYTAAFGAHGAHSY